jgi:hypothetical protein
MAMYVFFSKSTGQVVHVHQEMGLDVEPLPVPEEELASMDLRRPPEEEFDPEDIGVLEVDQNIHLLRRSLSPDERKALYVDTENRILVERDR